MSVESKIAARDSLLSHERSRKNLLFCSRLISNRGAAAIPPAPSDNGRVQPHAFTGMEREPTVGACAICGGPLTQDGRCLRCLADFGFLSGSQEPGRSETPRRLTPGSLVYDHFEVEVGADGFPVELGAGAMAITYRARDTVLNSVVALKVIDRRVAQNPGALYLGNKAYDSGAWSHAWTPVIAGPEHNPMGVSVFPIVFGLGFVLSFGYWCTNFLVVQRAMAAMASMPTRRAVS